MKLGEEEISAYLAKKVERKAIKVAKKLKNSGGDHYSNESNPFGDSNLTERFIWRKKIERDVINQKVSLETFSVKAEKKRQRELMVEFEKVKKRREERALERARRQEEKELLDRERAHAEFQDWEKKEAEFEFEQRKVRSEIRFRQGRVKAIDVLWKHINGEISDQPWNVFKGLTVREIEELRGDVKLYQDLDRVDSIHVKYWEAVMVVCDWELIETRKKELLAEEERGLHSSIEDDVTRFLKGKSHSELEKLQIRIESEMRAGTAKVVEYWEAVLKRIHVYKAMACLKEIQAQLQVSEQETAGSVSPKQIKECENGEVTDSEDMEEGEAVFASEVDLELHSQVEYRLKKPKYFNRVYTGYEWNKYNRTHHDYDNPPPKFVQGYKFNIFYPDLVDKGKLPTYTVEIDKEGSSNGETCILRFHAGPPYEDIAFRIVNKEWENSRWYGFRCTFADGMLKLYFNFKRYRYRR